MKIPLLPWVLALFGLMSCAHQKKTIVSEIYIDSLISNYRIPAFILSNDSSMQFWKNRINPALPGIVSESKYAGFLSMRYHLFGDIQDIRKADSTIKKVDFNFNHNEAQANLTLVGYSILQHRFKDADAYLEKAKLIGLKKYDLLTTSFDVDFELGRYFDAGNELKELKSASDYGYFFRLSKMDHLNGLLDSSINAMLHAAKQEESNPYLEQVALSNAADLYIHAGDLKEAADLYKKCISLNGADFHSISGLGWITLIYDKNDSLAEKIFSFVHAKNKLPDALYKLAQVAEARKDEAGQKKWAKIFASCAIDSIYGNMYNKYLIELFTGILQDPSRAEQISKRELENRSTPQTNAWYAWSLFSNNKKKEAYDQFQKNVSGKPLEALELYWMGKLMQGLNKGYNAQAFYKAANINKFDLTPAILTDLEKQLE
ncbi:MAG TPA: hypothetical protein VK711_03480 [Puia sp.]|nr:hypothetical protein [Puia sp.]